MVMKKGAIGLVLGTALALCSGVVEAKTAMGHRQVTASAGRAASPFRLDGLVIAPVFAPQTTAPNFPYTIARVTVSTTRKDIDDRIGVGIMLVNDNTGYFGYEGKLFQLAPSGGKVRSATVEVQPPNREAVCFRDPAAEQVVVITYSDKTGSHTVAMNELGALKYEHPGDTRYCQP